MKKTLLSAAALMLTLLLSSACGGEAAPVSGTEPISADTETEQQAEPTRLDELGEHDFGGRTFTMLDCLGDININLPDKNAEGDIINDTIAQRNEQIAERYNVTFSYADCTDQGQRAQLVKQSVLADDPAYDVVFGTIPSCIGSLSTEGILGDLCSMPALSLDANWWSPLIYDSCRIGGKMYYTTGDISPISYRSPACFYANVRLLNQYGIEKDTLYNAVNEGKWTLDLLKQLGGGLDQDLNNDGKMVPDDDFFGILNETNNLTSACFLTAAGVDLCSVGTDGRLYTDLLGEPVITAIEKLSSVLNKKERKDTNALHTAFKSDRAVFLMHYVSSAYTRYRDMDADYVILPLPKFDEAQKTYRSLMNTWMNSFVAVPSYAATEENGVILEALAYLSNGMLRPTAYETAYKFKGARNEQDAQMLDIIIDTLYLDFNSFMEFGTSLNPITAAIFKDKAYVSAEEKLADKTKTEIDKFTAAWIGEE